MEGDLMSLFSWLLGLWVAPIFTIVALYIKLIAWIFQILLKIAVAMLEEFWSLLVYLFKEGKKEWERRQELPSQEQQKQLPRGPK